MSSHPVDTSNFPGMQCRLVELLKGPSVKEIKCQAHDLFNADSTVVVGWADAQVRFVEIRR